MNSIYVNAVPLPKNIKTKDLIANLASEICTCEGLLHLGYNTSNQVNLVDRIKYLQNRIFRLEKKKG